MNNSATGGYVKPVSTEALPRGLNLSQFIQTVLVGISGLDGTLVRPKWQVAPPKQPDLDTDWIAFGISSLDPDTYGYVGVQPNDSTQYQRQEGVQVGLSFYGPKAEEIFGLVRDGFQLQQNLEALRFANMGFTSIDRGQHVPDLVNERWINRIETTLYFRRQVQRVYPILPIVSANGTIHTVVGNEEYLLAWKT